MPPKIKKNVKKPNMPRAKKASRAATPKQRATATPQARAAVITPKDTNDISQLPCLRCMARLDRGGFLCSRLLVSRCMNCNGVGEECISVPDEFAAQASFLVDSAKQLDRLSPSEGDESKAKLREAMEAFVNRVNIHLHKDTEMKDEAVESERENETGILRDIAKKQLRELGSIRLAIGKKATQDSANAQLQELKAIRVALEGISAHVQDSTAIKAALEGMGVAFERLAARIETATASTDSSAAVDPSAEEKQEHEGNQIQEETTVVDGDPSENVNDDHDSLFDEEH